MAIIKFSMFFMYKGTNFNCHNLLIFLLLQKYYPILPHPKYYPTYIALFHSGFNQLCYGVTINISYNIIIITLFKQSYVLY
jgi:hypothetical protein